MPGKLFPVSPLKTESYPVNLSLINNGGETSRRVSEFTVDSRMCRKESQVLVLVLSCLLDGKLKVQVSSLPLQDLFCNL